MRRSITLHQKGFTLLEVMVAFALLALALTLLLGTMSAATRQVRNSEDASRAVLHGQSLMARAGVEEALVPGQREGQFEHGRYRWRMQVEPYADPHMPTATPMGMNNSTLLQLTLDVEWGEGSGQHVRWETLRLTPASGMETLR